MSRSRAGLSDSGLTIDRRRFGAGVFGLVAAAGFSVRRAAGQTPDGASPMASPVAGTVPMLAVADPAAAVIHLVDTASLTVTGTVEEVAVQTHAGFLPTPDGRLYFVDELNGRLVAIDAAARIVGEVSIEGVTSHIATDPDARFVAVGTDNPEAPVVVVDVATWEARALPLPEAGEVGLALTAGGDVLLHRNDVSNQLESHRIDDVLSGEVAPVGAVPIGAFGHGEAFDPATGRMYCATDDGVDIVQVDGTDLAFVATVPWDADGRSGGRAWFHRLNADGTALVTYLANREAPEEEWGVWENDLFVVDAGTLEATRAPLGNGLLYRYALSHGTALFTVMGTDGDVTHIVDLASGQTTGQVPLEPLAAGPVEGESPWEAEGRITAITPDGSRGFVTHGGDGIISVIDVASQHVTATITIDTPLTYGGYLAVFGTADIVFDPIGR